MLVLNPVFGQAGNLSLIQFGTDYADTFRYVTFREAFEKNQISITEVDSSGSVNSLMINNRSDEFVFLSDGDLLQGAKQNRVLNTSVLVMPHTKIVVPVSCVEAGRWRYTRSDFGYSEFSAPSHIRRVKHHDVVTHLREGHGHSADQGKVWDEVSNYASLHNESSPTSDMLNTFEKKKHMFDKNINDIFPEVQANAVAIFNGRKLVSVESFNSRDVYRQYFQKLIRTAMMDSAVHHDDRTINKKDAFLNLERFVNKLTEIEFEKHKAVAAGEESRFASEEMTCYELIYEGKTIHFSALLNYEEKKEKIYRDSRGMIVINFGNFKGRTFRDILSYDYDYAMRILLSSELSESMKRELFEEALRYAPRH